MPLLMSMTQVSLIGYLIGGAFLSLAYLDLPYYLMAFVVLAEVLVRRASTGPVGLAASPAVPAPGLGGAIVSRSGG
jgi:hypothetical protein